MALDELLTKQTSRARSRVDGEPSPKRRIMDADVTSNLQIPCHTDSRNETCIPGLYLHIIICG